MLESPSSATGSLETALGPGREFDLIRAVAQALGDRGEGLGGDCALVELDGATVAVSTDTSVEDVHFRRSWLTPEEIGWRAAAAALSDLAAVAARPVGLVAAVTVPAREPPLVVELMRGVGAAAASVGAKVLGGDLTHGPGISLTITVLGTGRRFLRRSGGRSGDRLWVTGALGGARAALVAWESGQMPRPEWVTAFASPRPRVAAARWLLEEGARALIDVSDGLASDAAHLAAASQVAVEVDLDRLPMASGLAAVAGSDLPAVFAARGGEDYELLAMLPEEFGAADAARLEEACGVALTPIGRVTSGNGLTLLAGGAPVTLSGYDHFA